jgi:hypothetical protein
MRADHVASAVNGDQGGARLGDSAFAVDPDGDVRISVAAGYEAVGVPDGG